MISSSWELTKLSSGGTVIWELTRTSTSGIIPGSRTGFQSWSWVTMPRVCLCFEEHSKSFQSHIYMVLLRAHGEPEKLAGHALPDQVHQGVRVWGFMQWYQKGSLERCVNEWKLGTVRNIFYNKLNYAIPLQRSIHPSDTIIFNTRITRFIQINRGVVRDTEYRVPIKINKDSHL